MEPSEYNNHPISISDSSNKHAIIDNRGKLYISDDEGQQLTQVSSSQRFTDVFQSENSIGMIAEKGQVYLLGSNISGIIPNVDQILYPTKLDLGFSYSAKKIVLGEASLAILMNNQTVYFYGSLGGKSYNQVLNLNVNDISGMITEYGDTYVAVSKNGRAYFWNKSALPDQPRVVFLQEPAKSVSLGNNHVLVLTKSGNVYSWGQNNFSQLGSIWGSKFKESKSPIKVQLDEPIRFISAGIFNSLALTESGQLYVWGLVTFPIWGQTDQARLGWIDKPLKITLGSPIEYAISNNDLLITVSQGIVNYSKKRLKLDNY